MRLKNDIEIINEIDKLESVLRKGPAPAPQKLKEIQDKINKLNKEYTEYIFKDFEPRREEVED